MTKRAYRNKWELQAAVINACPGITVSIMTKSNIGGRPVREILSHLIEKGHLVQQADSTRRMSSHKHAMVYYSTIRGREYSALIKKVQEAS